MRKERIKSCMISRCDRNLERPSFEKTRRSLNSPSPVVGRHGPAERVVFKELFSTRSAKMLSAGAPGIPHPLQ